MSVFLLLDFRGVFWTGWGFFYILFGEDIGLMSMGFFFVGLLDEVGLSYVL